MKPEFWKDARLAALGPATRLVYIGLWMVADDSGWFRADVPELGFELFGYDPRKTRERAVSGHLESLSAAGRIVTHPCGHALIPTFVAHQRLAGETKRVHTVKREHEACSRLPAIPRTSSQTPDTVRSVEVSNGQESKGTVSAPANAPDGAGATELSEWQQRIPRSVISGKAS